MKISHLEVYKKYLRANHDPSAPENRIQLADRFEKPKPTIAGYHRERDEDLHRFQRRKR